MSRELREFRLNSIPERAVARVASLFLLALVVYCFISPASAVIVAKNQRTSNIPIQYKPFLSGVGLIKSGRGFCTAFCIAENAVATSQHCLRLSNGRWRSASLNYHFSVEHQGKVYQSRLFGEDRQSRRMSIAFGLKKNTGYGFTIARDLRSGDSDWAFIKLKQKICNSVLPVKQLVGLASRTLPGREEASMVSAERFNKRSTGKRWMYSGKCQFLQPNIALPEGAIAHNCDSIPGTSGAPIFLKDDSGKLAVVAINSGHWNFKDKKSNKKTRLNYATKAGLFGDSITHFLAHNRISDSTKIKELQASLKKLNYLNGNVDGVFGPDTRVAIFKFENSIGLPELGLPSELIFDLLAGNREIPKTCLGRRGMTIFPSECRTIGLQPN